MLLASHFQSFHSGFSLLEISEQHSGVCSEQENSPRLNGAKQGPFMLCLPLGSDLHKITPRVCSEKGHLGPAWVDLLLICQL